LLIDCKSIEMLHPQSPSNHQSAISKQQCEDQMPVVYKGRVFSVEVDRRRFSDGREHEVAIVRHPPAVVIVPIEDDGRIVLIRQYRAALDRELWEVPAGSLDPGESADAAARRECEEEIGRAPGRVERLGAWYPTPGYCDEEMIFFRASALRVPAPDSPHKPDEDENIQAQTFTVADARAMVTRGDIIDLKTAFALTLI
jgi:ADP-ribose pyrophosphatase